MTLRLDALYGMMVELEERIEDTKLRKNSIEMETITLDNVYKIMQNFGKLNAIISDEEKKSLITYLIKEIQIFPNGESEMPLKSIEFNFPIYINVDLCQYFGQKKLKDYATFFSSSSFFC